MLLRLGGNPGQLLWGWRPLRETAWLASATQQCLLGRFPGERPGLPRRLRR